MSASLQYSTGVVKSAISSRACFTVSAAHFQIEYAASIDDDANLHDAYYHESCLLRARRGDESNSI